MKLKNLLFLLAIALVFAITACGGDDDPPQQAAPPTVVQVPTIHTVSILGHNVQVKGEDVPGFAEAKTRLQAGLTALEVVANGDAPTKQEVNNILNREGFAFVIEDSTKAPYAADEKRSMKIGAQYLNTSDTDTILNDMLLVIAGGAFGYAQAVIGQVPRRNT